MLPLFCPNKACRHYYHPMTSRDAGTENEDGTHLSRGSLSTIPMLIMSKKLLKQDLQYRLHGHTELSYRRILTHIITCSGIRDIARI
jgi:hypothetical protein